MPARRAARCVLLMSEAAPTSTASGRLLVCLERSNKQTTMPVVGSDAQLFVEGLNPSDQPSTAAGGDDNSSAKSRREDDTYWHH